MLSGMEATQAELDSFAQALSERLAGRSKREFGEALAAASGESVSEAAISLWVHANAEPTRRKVFAMEQVLAEKPGALSRLLGYLPTDAKPALTVEAALLADGSLSPGQREMLLSALRSARKR